MDKPIMDKPKITDEELKRLREKWQHSGFPELIALIDEVEELRTGRLGEKIEKIRELQAIVDRVWPSARGK
jgi:hypothetical protein